MGKKKHVRVAVVQAASVLFNLEKSVEKSIELIKKAAALGAELILFPEAFLPGYPRGMDFGAVVGSRTLDGKKAWQIYFDNALELPGEFTDKIGKTVKECRCHVVIGVIEKDARSMGTLYCTMLYFGPDGKIMGKHRKLKPTGSERIIWGEGQGDDLDVYHTSIGRIGGLICWENYMPLARMALYQQGIGIYLAPTADARDEWQATVRHIALEGRCFVLSCNQFVTKDMYPENIPGVEKLADEPNIMSKGGSVIISPFGEALAGPLFDKEDILYADLDLDWITRGKMDFDVSGHYHRPDVFKFDYKPK
ncbi:carbon-nitrogen hydrolase family protein [Flexithrix dorotheae]|uniref:carbon-nitrogen hydrolase family protein n=1 Tax=Flexithrix dorotheae TaxID=70993 RepID=UPI00037F06DD|nr:carbon-nitrogen hydrolase family protein [Flexithrix dorotheae]